MTHASLFSGIGGFDLAAEWAGFTNAFNCEIDPFCQKILKYHFPDAEQYGDIKTTDFTLWRGRIDILTGGFPCQPFSLAGKRKGTEDDRYLWPEMLRAIREIQPRWIVGENVLGIVNWSKGMVFEQVCSDLEAEGYEVQPFILPAAGVGAPHQRYRVWFVAHHVENAECVRCNHNKSEEGPEAGQFGEFGAGGHGWICGTTGIASDGTDAGDESMQERENGIYAAGTTADSVNAGLERKVYCREQTGEGARNDIRAHSARRRIPGWSNFPTQSPVRGRDDGLSCGLDGITVPSWRIQSVKGFGNAVVPQIPLQIFETIKEYENLTKSR